MILRIFTRLFLREKYFYLIPILFPIHGNPEGKYKKHRTLNRKYFRE